MKIELEFNEPSTATDSIAPVGGWKVTQGEKYSDGLTFEEMLGLIATLTMPKEKQCTCWMRTEAEHKAMVDSWSKKDDIVITEKAEDTSESHCTCARRDSLWSEQHNNEECPMCGKIVKYEMLIKGGRL